MKKVLYILYLLLVIVTMAACSETVEPIFGGGEIAAGDKILFTTLIPDVMQHTRTAKDEWQTEVNSYKAVDRAYTFNIEMWKGGVTPVKVGESTYKPISEDVDGVLTYSADGTLQNVANPLYWQDNVSKWGFRATAGTEELETDQTDQAKWLAQDRLVGYSYLPIWEGTDAEGHATDNFDQINYRTSKEWYRDNQTAKQLSGLMVESNEDYKKIPLYLQHQRSWVTIILKAGEGVTREALAYATSGENIHTTIYSYKNGESTAIRAWASEEFLDYEADKNGAAANHVSTTRYDAIVEPHNFIETREKEERDIIARISVSNQNFTFAAANDMNYASYIASGDAPEVIAAKEAMMVYNLQPGKHLTITATLSRASRMIMITAWIEDWTETVTQTICDDYGQNGDPILINNRKQLLQFLMDKDMNKAGNVGLIVPNTLPLDSATYVWPIENADSLKNVTLHATLNLAGCQLITSKQFVKEIARTGSIINGEVRVTDTFEDSCAIAGTNYGTVERINVTTSGELTNAQASKAGLVDTNYGTIYQCSSALPVFGTTAGYVGGIAATSLFKDDGVSPVIDACTVTARVDGNEDVTAGGGIVGQAEGRVSYNTFEYGITLLQNHKFYNIIAAIGTNAGGLTNHENNSWPTTERYTVSGSSTEIVNSTTGTHYNAVIDRRDELKEVLTSGYNNSSSIYRLANSFSVDKENWIWGSDILKGDYFATNSSGTYASGTVKFKLDCNDKTITLTGETNATMLFGSIIGEVYDLNLVLDKPIVAARIKSDNQSQDDANTDAIAAFAYAVTTAGDAHGQIRNITLKGSSDMYIESTTPAGIAVWAMHGGVLNNCTSDVAVRMHITADGMDARHYAGGIVAAAENAIITQCKYYNDHGVGWATGTDEAKAQKNNCRYGGIVGGTSEIASSHTTPHLTLSDCYSWWELPTFGQDVQPDNRPVMGGIIGSTVYHDNADATRLFNAMADGNAGNWWVGTTGAGLLLTGVTEEKAIGRKNSVVPSK